MAVDPPNLTHPGTEKALEDEIWRDQRRNGRDALRVLASLYNNEGKEKLRNVR
jgi:hypothetical protein